MQGSAGYFDSVRAHFPSGTKNLRACIQCRLIMEKSQFIELGCPQCVDLKMQENESRVIACTTQNFDGYMANIRPGGFSTRFIGLEKSMPGFYALVVRGEIPPEITFDDEGGDLAGFIREGSDSAIEDELFGPGQPAGKKRKTGKNSQVGMPQPPSSGGQSSTSDADDAPGTAAMQKALAFLEADPGSAPGSPNASGVEASEQSSKQQQVVASGTSASDRDSDIASKRGARPASSTDRDSVASKKSKQSDKSGTSRGSVAILEPEIDDEFADQGQ